MSKLFDEAAMAAIISMNAKNLRASDRIRVGREVRVTQEKKEKEGGRKEEKRAGEKIDEDEDDEYVEGSEGNMFNQPSSRDPKPADWESWSWERKKEWWAPRNAARKARKVAARQKQAEQEAAEKAAAEKTVSSERTPEKLCLTFGPYSQNAQYLPYQQHQQGSLAGYTHSGRGELPGAAYQTLQIPPNPLSDRPLTWVSPTYGQALPSPYYTPQHKDYKSGSGNIHALPARPVTPLPKLTANASTVVQSKYRKIEKGVEKKFETYEQTCERIRGEERKKLEEERKSMEEERAMMEWEKKEMEEEWKKIGWERKKVEGGMEEGKEEM